MRHISCRNIRLVIAIQLLFLLPLSALAMPAITCHCFTDRSFNPEQPALADPYFLATTQNSFMAALFKIDKKTIVLKKQQGTSSDDLWIACWAAFRSGVSYDTLLLASQENENWQDVFASLRLSSKSMGQRFIEELNAKSSSARLAEAVVDELFLRHRLLSGTELAQLRKAGASNQELIIATLIAVKTRQPAGQILFEVKSGSKTWGALLIRANIDPKNMQQELSAILKLQN